MQTVITPLCMAGIQVGSSEGRNTGNVECDVAAGTGGDECH